MRELLPYLGQWSWWVIGAILLLLELLLPGVFFMWLGIAALVIGVIDIFVDLSWQIEVAIFAVLSVVSLLFLRPHFKERLSRSANPNLNQRMYDYVGKRYVLDQAIVNGSGKVRIDDTLWVVTGADRARGEWVKVTGVDGLKLIVEALEGST
jgi:membrane protein implicated in regulation of membrane protease activity